MLGADNFSSYILVLVVFKCECSELVHCEINLSNKVQQLNKTCKRAMVGE